MKHRVIKALILPLTLASLSVSLSGCSKTSDPLIVWTFTKELKTMIEDYYLKANPKANVSIQTIELNSMKQKLALAIQTGKNVPDLVALEAQVVQSFTEQDYLADLQSIIDTGATDDMYSYTKDVATNPKGEVVGLSWQATPGGFFYRADLAADKLGITTPEQMQEHVKDWASYLALAQSCVDNGLKISSSMTDSIKVFLSERSNAWVKKEDGKTKLVLDNVMFGNTDASVTNCYDTLKTIQQGGMSNETEDRGPGWFSDISGSKVLSYFCSSWGLYYDLKANAKTTDGHWAMCKGPSNYYNGGTWLSVLKTSKHLDEAKAMVKYFTTDVDFLSAWGKANDDFMNNKKVMAKMKENYSCSFLGGQNHLNILYEVADAIKGDLISPYDSGINSDFTSFAADYAMQKRTITREDSIDQFSKKVVSTYPSISLA